MESVLLNLRERSSELEQTILCECLDADSFRERLMSYFQRACRRETWFENGLTIKSEDIEWSLLTQNVLPCVTGHC